MARSDSPPVVRLVRKLLGVLSKEEVVLEEGIAKSLKKRGKKIQAMRVDAIITVGGDGTVLHANREAQNVPILGINMGGTGFLADVSPAEAEGAIEKLLAGELRVRERARVRVEIGKRRLPDALNEIMIASAIPGKTLAFRTFVDGKIVYDMKGDGIIVATPTGSTAYAWAAGGPIVDPRLSILLLTPVCASRPGIPPIVVPASSRIELELVRRDRPALVVVDGKSLAKAKPGERLIFHVSENPARFFEWKGEFYRKLKEKLW